jgi:hypothetical protein
MAMDIPAGTLVEIEITEAYADDLVARVVGPALGTAAGKPAGRQAPGQPARRPAVAPPA